jgi:hypothetical protein
MEAAMPSMLTSTRAGRHAAAGAVDEQLKDFDPVAQRLELVDELLGRHVGFVQGVVHDLAENVDLGRVLAGCGADLVPVVIHRHGGIPFLFRGWLSGGSAGGSPGSSGGKKQYLSIWKFREFYFPPLHFRRIGGLNAI